MIWNSFSHLFFQVTKKQVITHRALAHADGPTQVGNDWKLEKSKLDKSSPFQQGERWKRLQMIDQSRKKVQISSSMRTARWFCILPDQWSCDSNYLRSLSFFNWTNNILSDGTWAVRKHLSWTQVPHEGLVSSCSTTLTGQDSLEPAAKCATTSIRKYW